jgi:tetratricopeptide (TPR) repeat protein
MTVFRGCLQLAGKLHAEKERAVAYSDIGYIYVLQNQKDSAVLVLLEGLHFSETHKFDDLLPAYCLSLMEAYVQLNKFERAEYYTNKLLALDTLKKDKRLQMAAYYSATAVYTQGKKWDKQRQYFNQAYALTRELGQKYYMAKLLLIDVDRLVAQRQFAAAKPSLLESLTIWQKMNIPEEIAYTQALLSGVINNFKLLSSSSFNRRRWLPWVN